MFLKNRLQTLPSASRPLMPAGGLTAKAGAVIASLMTPPSKFEDGFSWISLAGAGFVALLMVPGAMYMSLLVGGGIGSSAQWVTVILFIEIAKRAHKALGKAEIFVFFYIAGGLLASPFGGLLWSQFFVQSDAASTAGISDMIPTWVAPHDPAVLKHRSFFMWQWLPVIGMVIFQQFVSRLNTTILCYGLFRVASDIERLPFPMAPVGAQGILALAEDADEAKDETGRWRWRVFSIGGAIGMAFALVYVGLPSLSQAYFNERLEIFPIPFADWTGKTQELMPAVATGLSFDLGNIIYGMVVPFFAVIGSAIGMVVTFILNPILQHHGMLRKMRGKSGDDTVTTSFKNQHRLLSFVRRGHRHRAGIDRFLRDLEKLQKRERARSGAGPQCGRREEIHQGSRTHSDGDRDRSLFVLDARVHRWCRVTSWTGTAAS